MSDKIKPRRTLWEVVKSSYQTALVIGGIAAFTTVFTLGHLNYSKIYNGPSKNPAVVNINAELDWSGSSSFEVLKYHGNRIELKFNNGQTAKIRDYEGDFKFNHKDTITGVIPKSVKLNDVLEELHKKANARYGREVVGSKF